MIDAKFISCPCVNDVKLFVIEFAKNHIEKQATKNFRFYQLLHNQSMSFY